MKIKAQLSMSFNLEKCIGCNTCTVTCKNVWTNRKGTEYMWWNNVETNLVLVIRNNGKNRICGKEDG